jgi:hypothetical protein
MLDFGRLQTPIPLMLMDAYGTADAAEGIKKT